MSSNKTFRLILSAAIIIAFFLPWFSTFGSSVSALNLVLQNSSGETDATTTAIVRYSFLLIPLFALIILIRSATNSSSGFLLRLLPFLVTAILTTLFIVGILDQGGGKETLNSWFQILGVGFYITIVGSFLLLFA